MVEKTPLREYRQGRKMTLRELATIVGVSESQLSRIERDGTQSLERAVALATKTGLPVESFLRRAAA